MKKLCTVKEGRVVLGGIGHTKMYELIGSGELEAIKIGRRTFLTLQSLDAFVQSRPKMLTARTQQEAAKL
jgi:helix-turn-helix protein